MAGLSLYLAQGVSGMGPELESERNWAAVGVFVAVSFSVALYSICLLATFAIEEHLNRKIKLAVWSAMPLYILVLGIIALVNKYFQA